MNPRTIAMTAVLLAAATTPLFAALPVGFNKITVPANSDARVSVPFTQAAEGQFTVSSVAGSFLNVTNTLVPGAYAGQYYVRMISGSGEGLWSTINSNGTNSIELSNSAVIPFIAAGNTFRIYKHQTLATVFPKGLYGTSFTNGTQVYFYSNQAAGINKSSTKLAIYTTSAGGKWTGAGITGNTVIEPETQIIVRNLSALVLRVFTLGYVPDFNVSALILPGTDILTGSGYPVPVTLNNSGIGALNRQVYLYNNSTTGINKSSEKLAIYTTKWVGAGITGNEPIKPSESITLRLPAAETGVKVTFTKPY